MRPEHPCKSFLLVLLLLAACDEAGSTTGTAAAGAFSAPPPGSSSVTRRDPVVENVPPPRAAPPGAMQSSVTPDAVRPQTAVAGVGCVTPDAAAVQAANALCKGGTDFAVLSDGTAISCETGPELYGLRWQLDVNPAKMNFQSAVNYCENLNLARMNWSVPCERQLRSAISPSNSRNDRLHWEIGGPEGPYWAAQVPGDVSTSVVVEVGVLIGTQTKRMSVDSQISVRCVSAEPLDQAAPPAAPGSASPSVPPPPPPAAPICGNNKAEGDEQCDGADLKGMTCATLGVGSSTSNLRCNGRCTFDTLMCIGGGAP